MRTHGHRAARIDPLDLIQREEVAALFPGRYGLNEEEARYNVNGILWTKRVGEQGDEAEWWTLGEIRRHLREVYVGRIGYEVRASFLSVHGCVLIREQLVYALPIQDGEALVLPFVGVAVLAVA